MTIKINSNQLLELLTSVSGCLTNASSGISSNCFTVGILNNKLTVITSKNAGALVMMNELIVETNEALTPVLIEGRLIMDILKNLPNATISMIFKEHSLLIQSGQGKYNIPLEKAVAIPLLNISEDERILSIDNNIFQDAVSRVAMFLSKDDIRIALSGTYIEFEKDKLIFTGTDAHRLINIKINHNNDIENKKILIHRDATNTLKQLNNNKDISMYLKDEKSLIFKSGNLLLKTPLIDAHYPDYRSIIPTENNIEATIDRSLLLNTMKRCLLFSHKANSVIRFDIKNNLLFMDSKDVDLQLQGEDSIECESVGAIEISVNGQSLYEIISSIKSNKVKMTFSTHRKAILLFPLTEGDAADDSIMLIMPILL